MEVDAGEVPVAGGRQFYDEKLAALAEERAQVEAGTHQALTEGKKELAVARDKQLKDAAMLRELRMREVEALHTYECKAAKETYNNAVSDVKENLLNDLNESIKRLEDLRDGTTDAEVRSSSRKLRSKRMDGEEEPREAEMDTAGVPNGSGDSTKSDPFAGQCTETLSGLKFFMKESQVLEDLRQIQRDWKKRAEMFLSEAEVQEQSVKVADGVLYYNEHILEKDAEIVFTLEMSKEELSGTIVGLNPSDITVKLPDGTLARLILAHLRAGRATVAPVVEE